jgi:hypothetical protein
MGPGSGLVMTGPGKLIRATASWPRSGIQSELLGDHDGPWHSEELHRDDGSAEVASEVENCRVPLGEAGSIHRQGEDVVGLGWDRGDRCRVVEHANRHAAAGEDLDGDQVGLRTDEGPDRRDGGQDQRVLGQNSELEPREAEEIVLELADQIDGGWARRHGDIRQPEGVSLAVRWPQESEESGAKESGA